MSSYIKRGESVFFQFRNGKSVLNSQCKPRMFKTAEKATLGLNYIDTDEIVEYAEVVRCKDCKYTKRVSVIEGYFICGLVKQTVEDNDFCSYGKRKN